MVSLKIGDRICGFDFGSTHRQITLCLIEYQPTTSEAPEITIVPESEIVITNFRVIDWGFLTIPMKCTLQVVSEHLVRILQQDPVFCSAKFFVFEKQPPKNAKAYAISWMLASLLKYKTNALIEFMRPDRKFRILDGCYRFRPDEQKQKHHTYKQTKSAKQSRQYRQRKKWAVQLCNALLKSQPPNLSSHIRYQQAQKKDDLADAMLYAVAFLQANVYDRTKLATIEVAFKNQPEETH